MRIIVAEDEQRARQGMVRLLQGLGEEYEVIAQASNGNMALDLILQMRPDVVFIDIKMPFMDGLSVIQAIRSHNMATEFVVVSAYADFGLAQQSISLDVAGYLLKPMIKEEAVEVLEKIKHRMNGRQYYGLSGKRCSLRETYPNVHPLIGKALDIIENSYAGKISQKDLAKELGLTPEYFSYLFSKNVNDNFSTFLKNYHIKMARRMYEEGCVDRREIPYKVGYSDAKYYNKVFREVTGQTPAEYLNSMQNA